PLVRRSSARLNTRVGDGPRLAEPPRRKSNHKSWHTAIAHEQVGADADDCDGNFRWNGLQKGGQILLVLGLEQHLSRTAGPKPGDLLHTDIGRDASAHARKRTGELFDQRLTVRHAAFSAPASSFGRA